MRRIAITGMGIVSCLGNQLDRVSAALRSGLSGIRRDEAAVEAGLRSQVSGAPDIDLPARIDRKVLRFMGDGAAYAYLAMKEAIAEICAIIPGPVSAEAVATDVGKSLVEDRFASAQGMLKSGVRSGAGRAIR